MAEESPAPTTTVETSPMAEEAAARTEDSPPNGAAAPPEEETEAKETEMESLEAKADSPAAAEHKRKLTDLEGEEEKKVDESKAQAEGAEMAAEFQPEVGDPAAEAGDAKRQRVDGDADGSGVDGGHTVEKVEDLPVGNGQLPLPDSENIQSGSVGTIQNSTDGLPQQGVLPSAEQETASRKIEIPNNKVGVLIGKAGETIRQLQNNSGVKIQITRDGETDPNSSCRLVELVGTLEDINKAELLIKNVIAEADAGGSPALVARGFSATGSEEYEMQVPNEKVGQIIGRGGETIKRLQAESHARIQLIPQHLPEGEFQKERTVRITGNKKQIEVAKDKIKDVMNQSGRPSNFSGGYNHNRSRGPGAMQQWGPRGPSSGQSHPPPNAAYDYSQRGTYPPQATQYSQQSYGSGYPQQPPSRNNFSSGWEQRPAAPIQTGGYDYYGQGGQSMGTQPSNPPPAMSSGPVNYNYGQPPASGYNQANPYPQSGPQQGYGYNEPKYDNQAPSQQMYGQQPQPASNQQGFYPQQGSTPPQSGYSQQPPYGGKPPAAAVYAGAPQSYGPPRPTQPGDPMYQGAVPSSYGTGAPTQQPYPYNSTVPSTQPATAYVQSYGPPTGGADGYNQTPAGYTQPNNQVAPNYGQAGQGYAQPAAAQTGGYGQYPTGQPAAYGEPPAATNVNYGYQGAPADAGYGSAAPASGYGAAPGGQPGYGQVAGGYAQQPPAASTASYDQSMAAPQAGYGAYPANPAAGYAKGVSPQPAGYGGQY